MMLSAIILLALASCNSVDEKYFIGNWKDEATWEEANPDVIKVSYLFGEDGEGLKFNEAYRDKSGTQHNREGFPFTWYYSDGTLKIIMKDEKNEIQRYSIESCTKSEVKLLHEADAYQPEFHMVLEKLNDDGTIPADYDDGYSSESSIPYKFKRLSTTFLSDDDLNQYSGSELKIMRNAIYAIHGRRFRDAKLRNYFSSLDWYNPTRDEVPDRELNKYEKANVEKIHRLESGFSYSPTPYYSYSSDFSWLSTEYVSYYDLSGYYSSQLRIMRNAIYAMHGRRFKDADLRNYFLSCDWYYPIKDEIPVSELNKYEKANIETIRSME